VSFTVNDGKDTDLLAGDLKLQDAHAGHDHDEAARPWLRWAGTLPVHWCCWRWRAAAARRWGRRSITPLLAVAVVAAGLAVPHGRHGRPGHDHGEEAASAGGNSPKRQPDGSVFLPKPSQRQLGVRTVVPKKKPCPKPWS
jgi:cobalt-zinc-cadmium efflux system membrane fusion protein